MRILAAFLVLLAGCGSTSVVGETDTVWQHLVERYDSDGDAVVTADEYGRDSSKFERLDKDEDGALTKADFTNAQPMAPGQMDTRFDAMATQRSMMRWFQDDDNPGDLYVEEVTASFYRLDSDRDGWLSAAEYPGGETTWASFVAACDTDHDGEVALAETESFFNRRDRDGDGVWKRPPPRAGARRRVGVAEGEPAPDFTLRPPDGGDPVTLSSFRGGKPVALIFGSYT